MTEVYLRDVQVAKRYGKHRMGIWLLLKTDPTFPKPKKFSQRCSRWSLMELIEWEKTK